MTRKAREVTVATGSELAFRQGGRRPSALILTVLVWVVLGVYAVISLYPFLWMLSGAFKDQREVLDSASPIPARPTLDTILNTWEELSFGTLFWNSAKIACLTIVLVLIVYPLAAYAFSQLSFPGRKLLYVLFLGALLVPGVTVLLPLVILEQKLGILGSQWAVVLPLVNAGGPLTILLMKSFFDSIPRALHEAARVDGLNEFQIYTRVYFPLARPAVVTVTVLMFVAVWNEYVLPSVTLVEPGSFPLPLGLQNLLNTNVVQWNQVMAGAVFLVLPVIVVYVVLQRQVIDALGGAVKG